MSKVSVFKFDISNVTDQNVISSIIVDYLRKNGFNFNESEQFYIIDSPEKQVEENIGAETVGTMGKEVNTLFDSRSNPCFSYQIVGNQLIIKAYTVNPLSGIKAYIHSNVNTNMAGKEYYNNLKTNLFTELQKYNVTLVSTEKEKVNDGSSSKLLKTVLYATIPIIIIFGIIALISYLSTN